MIRGLGNRLCHEGRVPPWKIKIKMLRGPLPVNSEMSSFLNSSHDNFHDKKFNFFTKCDTFLIGKWRYKKAEFIDSTMNSAFFLDFSNHGVDGSRTRVQKPIPCPSTIIVCCFAAAHQAGCNSCHRLANRLPGRNSSFIIRPRGQSLPHVVSHKVDARTPKCGCSGPDKPPEATSLTAY